MILESKLISEKLLKWYDNNARILPWRVFGEAKAKLTLSRSSQDIERKADVAGHDHSCLVSLFLATTTLFHHTSRSPVEHSHEQPRLHLCLLCTSDSEQEAETRKSPACSYIHTHASTPRLTSAKVNIQKYSALAQETARLPMV